MLVRFVKMHFLASYVDEFKILFKTVQPKIGAYDGCKGVQLLQDANNPDIFFTVSHWLSDEHLNAYRKSELFTHTWAQVKPNFQIKAEAWSLLDS